MTNPSVEQTVADGAGQPMPSLTGGPECPPGVDCSGEDGTSLKIGSTPNGPTAGEDFVWPKPLPHPWRHPLAATTWIARVLFGAASLFLLLVVAASTPGLNILALGYMLEFEGGVARSGKLRHGFPLLPAAARLGTICLGCGLWLIPVWLLANAAAETRLVVGQGLAVSQSYAILAITATLIGFHLILALARGGRLGCFVRPIKNARWLRRQLAGGDYWPRADHELRRFLAAWRLPYHFWLGLRGFLGSAVWLIAPAFLFLTLRDPTSNWQRLLMFIGGAGVALALAWLPWLQARLAVENRWSAMFEPARVRELIGHAPLAWLLATVTLYALSIPMFLFTLHWKMRLPFYVDTWWDAAVVSLACTFPARVFVGWAYHRATARGRRWAGFVWLSRLLLAGLLISYVWLLYQTPLTHQSRHPWLLEYHILLLPIPW